jgi:hypothetical protein
MEYPAVQNASQNVHCNACAVGTALPVYRIPLFYSVSRAVQYRNRYVHYSVLFPHSFQRANRFLLIVIP